VRNPEPDPEPEPIQEEDSNEHGNEDDEEGDAIDEDDENGRLFVYDNQNQRLYPYIIISAGGNYTILSLEFENEEKDISKDLPAGYDKAELIIEKMEVDAWQLEDNEQPEF